LKAILPDDRGIWLKVGAALHLVGARAVWDDWSKTSGKFDADDQDRVWASFHGERKEGVVTIATIYAWAKERGWVPSVNAHDPAPAADTKEKALAALAMISSAKALQHEVFPPMKYAVKGYVVEGVTILAGRPKIGKSWLALDWNGAIARGGFCFGDLHCIEGAILYLALEDNKRRLKSRLNKLFGSTEWPENFEYATEWPTAKEGGIAAIRAWAKSRPNARAVTVDVLERFRTRSRSGNENAYAADYETIKELQSLASELNIAILVITHLRKGGDSDDPIEKISGTLGLSGGADAFLILDGNSNGQTLYGRGRDLEEFTKAVRFNRETCRWEILGEAADVKRSDERSRILEALKEADTAITPLQIAAKAGLRRGNVRFLLGKMVTDGEVLKGGRAKYAHPDNPEFLPVRPARKPK
jgi:hypothetical protein